MRANQWDETLRRDPENWTPDTWCEVYEFKAGIKEGWAGRKDRLFSKKFTGEVDPKEGFRTGKCKNPREGRMLEFMMPILNPDKPKRVTLTVANTLFGALSGVRPVNWGVIIQDIVEKGILLTGQRTSYLTPFILHLYAFYGCTTVDEDNMMILAEEEIRFRLQPRAEDDDKEGDLPFPDAVPSPPGSPPTTSRRAGSPPPSSPHHPAPFPCRPPPSPHAAGPIGPSRKRHGKTWIYPRGRFGKPPSSGCMRT